MFYAQNDPCIHWIAASKWTLFSSKDHGGPFKFPSWAKLLQEKVKTKKGVKTLKECCSFIITRDRPINLLIS